MTISVSGTGLPNVMGAADWSSLLQILAGGGGSQVVDTGLAVSMGSGTRLLNVAAGTAAAAGVLFKSTATEPVTLAANGSGNSRLDLVYAQINWAAGTGSIGALAGVPAPTPTLPMLTQTAGTTWQIPLASCLVRSGVVDLTAHPGDLVDARPLYTAMQLPHHGSGLFAGSLWSGNTDSSGIALVPHRLPSQPTAAVATVGASGQLHLTCAVVSMDPTNIHVFVRRSSDDVAATSAGVGLWWMAFTEVYA